MSTATESSATGARPGVRGPVAPGLHRRLDLARARQSVVLLVFARIALIILLFVLFNEWYRSAEIEVSTWILNAMFGSQVADALGDSRVLIVQEQYRVFIGVITPSCSAAASILVLAILATLLPPYLRRRRLAVVVAIAVVAVGNLVRIVAVLAVGKLYGREALVFFHDWAGSIFTFVYTILGFLLMLWFMLPARANEEV